MSERLMEAPFPFASSRAAIMLRDGLMRLKFEKRTSAREIARRLGYKQAVVLSHMASGRVAVPLERAAEIAHEIGLPPGDFLAAAVEQRVPAAANLLQRSEDERGDAVTAFVQDLSMIAGHPMSELTDDQMTVLREVVADPSPSRRWLTLAELPVMLALRKARREISRAGLTQRDREAIERALQG